MEPGAVSHYREAGVNFLLMDAGRLTDRNRFNGDGLGGRCSAQLFRR